MQAQAAIFNTTSNCFNSILIASLNKFKAKLKYNKFDDFSNYLELMTDSYKIGKKIAIKLFPDSKTSSLIIRIKQFVFMKQ